MAETFDLVIQEMTVGQLTTNAKAIREAVREKLAGYKPENYSEDNIQEAKKDKASLNNAAKALNQKRIELERQFLEPIAEFKSVVAEIVADMTKASGAIDSVVKAVEDRAKAEKKAMIEEWFSHAGFTTVALERLWDPAWLNKTCKLQTALEELLAKMNRIQSEMEVLDRTGEPDASACYLRTLDMKAALAMVDRLKADRETARKRRESEEERKRLAPPAPVATRVFDPEAPLVINTNETQREEVAVMENQKNPFIEDPEVLYERRFLVRGTKNQIMELGIHLNNSGIYWEKL